MLLAFFERDKRGKLHWIQRRRRGSPDRATEIELIADVEFLLEAVRQRLSEIWGADRIAQSFADIHNHMRAMEAKIMATMQDLADKVAALETVEDSAIALITGLAEQVRNLAPTQDAINALADKLDADKEKLSAAVTANT